MKLDLYQIDSFTDKIFGGNPACVVPLESWLPDDILLKIAKENAVAETAFFIPFAGANSESAGFDLRWFTPEIEMDLCGHATLATAHVLKTFLNYDENSISFHSKSGMLKVSVAKDMYTLDFPSRMPIETELPEIIKTSLSIQPQEVLHSRDYILVYTSEEQIIDIQINRQILDQINLDPGGVVITAQGNDCDFVSRYFTPQASIFEDPVTGSSHCSLIPFWSRRLNKKQMTALQLSDRVGKLYCEDKGERVLIAGNARTYSVANIWID
ncbi:PhzF family phenazine biosynthesis protein [Lacibacter sediminis]|uniref:PhzF family phenazine biosynthesis protein n=1 Tax=Lacibacter sediminis TaxID=2760713 RepID=A0A7G5XDC8_9BACT|nr:PhzF family phenazine biosynthesis protein [Lacibacter sediminis]QNA43481.1 PhzF family phenazine biosynthesis protein [Lacibacter sediminis]